MLYNRAMKQKVKLPEDEVRFISALDPVLVPSRLRALWEAGWSLGIIASSIKPAKPKSTVHFWVKNAPSTEQRRQIPMPPPKSLTVSAPLLGTPRTRSISPTVPPELRPRLQELSALAKRYRAKTSDDSPLAQANRELTELSLTLYHRGVPAADIAEAAGVTYRAMARRLSNG